MDAARQAQHDFWKAVFTGLKTGRSVIASVEGAKLELAGSPLEAATAKLIDAVQAGDRLSDAMKGLPRAFTQCECTMVRAGEAGGVLDVIAGRIAEGLADGSLPAPGEGDRADDPIRFWRAFGRMLSSGVPIGAVCELLAKEVAGDRYARAATILRREILDGRRVSESIRGLGGELFPDQVCQAVASAEDKGELDAAAFRIADAIEAGELDALILADLPEADAATDPSAGEVRKYVADLLTEAVGAGATDIHFDPSERGGRVRYRVDGVLRETAPPPDGLFERVVNRFKVMSNLDVAERRLPQDGIIYLKLSGKDMDVRISSLPVYGGERVVLRLLVRSQVSLELERYGFSADDLERVRRLCHLPNGVIVANGPTGCGKTTLLYCMLMELNAPERCIITIEDPVEYDLPGISQAAINPKIGLTYARGMIAALRQAPNIVMVGELRDLESVNLALQVAMTGHLLFTTLHCDDSVNVLKRMGDLGVEPFRINSALKGVVSTRLVRTLCDKCKQPDDPPPAHSLPPEAAELFAGRDDLQLRRPVGCDACGQTGFRGRTCIYEVFEMSDDIRQLLADGAELSAMRSAAEAAGMTPLLVNGLAKAAAGVTTVEEIVRFVPRM